MLHISFSSSFFCHFFCFNDTATTAIYTLSLHDALPISRDRGHDRCRRRDLRAEGPRLALRRLSASPLCRPDECLDEVEDARDRKSTRLNSSHVEISYAVFCLKKKNKIKTSINTLYEVLL